MVKKIFKIFFIFIIGAVGGIFADQILWPYFVERPLFYKYKLERPPIYLTKEIKIQENVALQEAIEKVEKVVVGVKTKTKRGKVLEGSGLVVTSDGLVVTLADLVPFGSKFNFFVDKKAVPFQILKRDLKENLALIKVKKENLATVPFAELEKLKLGERVFLVGLIFEKEKVKKIVNEGIVKGFDKNEILTNIFESEKLAGSPLFDIEGNFIGLNKIEKGKVITIPNSKIRSFLGF